MTCAWTSAGPRRERQCSAARLRSCVTFERVRAVAFLDVQVREIRDELRDAAARSLRFDGNGNRVAIVFDEKENRNAAKRGRVDGLEKFAFAGRSFSAGDVHDFVALETDCVTRAARAAPARAPSGISRNRATLPRRRRHAAIACPWEKIR